METPTAPRFLIRNHPENVAGEPQSGAVSRQEVIPPPDRGQLMRDAVAYGVLVALVVCLVWWQTLASAIGGGGS